jgi:hypothetical protein
VLSVLDDGDKYQNHARMFLASLSNPELMRSSHSGFKSLNPGSALMSIRNTVFILINDFNNTLFGVQNKSNMISLGSRLVKNS